MSRLIGLTGQWFVNLTVLHRSDKYKKKVYWACACDCGNIINVYAENLKRRHTTSCGCRRVHPYIGKRFGHLTVLEKTEKTVLHGSTRSESMFSYCSALENLNVTFFDTSNVERMGSMFYRCEHLITIYSKDDWNLAADCKSTSMFGYCNQLVGGSGTKYSSSYTTGNYARIDQGGGKKGYFTDVADKHYTLENGFDFGQKIFDYSDVIFGDYEHYPAFKAESGTPVDVSLYDQIYQHIDATKAYVLADCKIMANEDSYAMFSSTHE